MWHESGINGAHNESDVGHTNDIPEIGTTIPDGNLTISYHGLG